MILAAGALGLLYGLVLRHGRLASIFKKRFRLPVLLFISLGLEWLLAAEFGNSLDTRQWYLPLRVVLAIFQYSLLFVFLFRNRKKPGMFCLMAGSVMNGLVIIANSGRMPIGKYIAHFGDAAIAQISTVPHYFLAQGHEPLLFLADLFPFWTFGWYMISLGDILISIGMFRLAAYMSRRILRKPAKAVEHPADIGYTDGR